MNNGRNGQKWQIMIQTSLKIDEQWQVMVDMDKYGQICFVEAIFCGGNRVTKPDGKLMGTWHEVVGGFSQGQALIVDSQGQAACPHPHMGLTRLNQKPVIKEVSL